MLILRARTALSEVIRGCNFLNWFCAFVLQKTTTAAETHFKSIVMTGKLCDGLVIGVALGITRHKKIAAVNPHVGDLLFVVLFWIFQSAAPAYLSSIRTIAALNMKV